MKITRNSDNGGWSGEGNFRSTKIKFTIDAELWNSEPRKVLNDALNSLDRKWPIILSSITTELLSLYNDSWADPDSGLRPLSKEGFLNKLSLETLAIGDGSLFVYFSDGDLFAGHTISVSLIGESAPIAMLEG
jgi:hypothetical protein